MVFVLLLFSRSWWLNEMPHPVAAQDGVLLVGSFDVRSMRVCRSLDQLLASAIVVLPSFYFFNWELASVPRSLGGVGRHWTPNHWAGVNQGAYLLGLLLLIAIAWLWRFQQPRWERVTALIAAACGSSHGVANGLSGGLAGRCCLSVCSGFRQQAKQNHGLAQYCLVGLGQWCSAPGEAAAYLPPVLGFLVLISAQMLGG